MKLAITKFKKKEECENYKRALDKYQLGSAFGGVIDNI